MKFFQFIFCLAIFLQFHCNQSFESESKSYHIDKNSFELTNKKNNTNSSEFREVIQVKHYNSNISRMNSDENK